jgi:outer membrane protein assembly factor BamA
LVTGSLALLFLLSSCNPTRYLEEGESFTGKNRILLKSEEKIEKKAVLKDELSLLYKQNRNNNQFGVWIYYENLDPGDTLWYHNFARRFFAETPSIFSEDLARLTASEMEFFLQNKRGFYNARVSYELFDDIPYETGVDYIVKCGKRYHIRSVDYYCEDSTIQRIVDLNREGSFLRPGQPVSSRDYDLEKNRLSTLLQNEGYAQFYGNYIELTGDSSRYQVDLTVNVFNPTDSTLHRKFQTGEISVYTDYHPNQETLTLQTDTLEGVVYHRELDRFFVKPSLISSMIGMRSGDQTSNRVRQESYNRLSLLHPYKFIAIKQKIDSIEQSRINYDILMIPKSGIWYWSPGFEFNYTTLSQLNQLFGLGVNFSLENDNLFNGAERFELNFNADTDIRFIQFKPQEFYLQNANNLFFPRPIGMHRISLFSPAFRLLNKKQYYRFSQYASTKLSIGASYESLENTISILSGSASLGYQYRPSQKEIVHINQISVDYYSPTIVDTTLFPGEFFRNSLSPRIITGLFFKDIAYAYNSQTGFGNYSWQFYTGLELSGHEIVLINKLFNGLTGNTDTWALESQSLKFAKYAKSYMEWRGQYQTGPNSRLASRFYFGLGIPYGDNNVLPYSKQFYVGGPQSLRAWEKRGLGPGGYYDPQPDGGGNGNEIAYQKGDIKLEANLEYRFELPWYFEGAVFVDAGNIWTFNDDEKLENENFTRNFYRQIAVAGGAGLRLNFNFLLLRLDLGYKLRKPYPDPETLSYWHLRHTNLFRDGYLTFGLDYPF